MGRVIAANLEEEVEEDEDVPTGAVGGSGVSVTIVGVTSSSAAW